MTKLREDGLLVNPKWHDAPFAGIILGSKMDYNGVNVENPLMIISVTGNPAAFEFFGIGSKTYIFVAAGARDGYDEINIGATTAITATNIITKINADKHNGTGCTAYALGKDTLILLVDNLSESHHASPGFSDAGCIGKLVEDMPWMNSITQHMLLDYDYFRINETTDVNAKPITLTTQRYGGAGSPSYQNFLY